MSNAGVTCAASTFLTTVAVKSGDRKKKEESHVFSQSIAHPEDEALFSELQDKISAVTELSQATMLIQKRKELAKINSRLSDVRASSKTSLDECHQRQRLFERKRRDIRQKVEETQSQIKESNEKYKRAEAKERAEIKQQRKLDGVIAGKRELLKKLGTEKIRQQERLSRVLKYQDFLEDVVESSPAMYEEISDVLKRHEMLRDTKRDLETSVEESTKDVERLRGELQRLRSEGHKSILVQQALIHKYQMRSEKLQLQSLKASTQIELDSKALNQSSREYAHIMMATRNLYARCLATKKGRRSNSSGPRSPSNGNATKVQDESSKKTKKSATARDVFDSNVPIRDQMDAALQFISSRVIVLSDIKRGYAAWERKRHQTVVE